MTIMPALLERFPARELEIRRLLVRDEDFRCACEDYEEAVKALRHWEHVQRNAIRATEYRQLAAELAVEITAFLDAASAHTTTR